jgi:hypothetical protein
MKFSTPVDPAAGSRRAAGKRAVAPVRRASAP